jgi:hypothetical protein
MATHDFWITIAPLCASNARLSFDDAKVCKTHLLLELIAHGDTGCSGTNQEHRNVGMTIAGVSFERRHVLAR